jgi:hypothetical protein
MYRADSPCPLSSETLVYRYSVLGIYLKLVLQSSGLLLLSSAVDLIYIYISSVLFYSGDLRDSDSFDFQPLVLLSSSKANLGTLELEQRRHFFGFLEKVD